MNMGCQLGGAVTSSLTPWIGQRFGWPAAFGTGAAVVLLGTLAWAVVDPTRPLAGVFSTRSPDRPNPIGLHRVEILAIDGLRVLVQPLEALDQTPIVDVKPVLDAAREQ